MTQTASYTCLIVEDDYMNATLLRGMLQELQPDLRVLERTATVEDSSRKIRELQPDLVFMDIHLADGSGLDVLKATQDLDYEVVFTTAYDQYAIQAFEVEALHYLLKPLDPEELEKALRRFLDKGRQSQLLNRDVIKEKIDKTNLLRLPIATQNEVLYLPAKDLRYIQAEGSYTRLVVENRSALVASKAIGYFERMLEGTSFFRIHDKYVVNLLCIEKYIKGKGGEIVLKTGEVLPVSVRRKADFMAYFEHFNGL